MVTGTTDTLPLFARPNIVADAVGQAGQLVLRSADPLTAYPVTVVHSLRTWAEADPGHLLIAERNPDGGWRRCSYGTAVAAAGAIGQALLDRGLGPHRPLMLLSGNGVDHLLLTLGAMTAGVPVAPVSVAYSLQSHDHARIKAIADLIAPGAVFADDAVRFAPALDALSAVPAIISQGIRTGADRLADLTGSRPGPEIEAAFGRLAPDAADARLFQGAVWCLAPLPTTTRDAIDEAVHLVEELGASPYFLDPDEHDGLVASVSHLPYLMSVALIRHLGRERSWRETASLAAGGFAYSTHLSDSDPRMFADIVRTNRDNIARRLELYIAELEALRQAIAGDSPELKAQFEEARTLHQDWLAGRAQGHSAEGENPLPTTRSMLTGSLFGRFGRDKS